MRIAVVGSGISGLSAAWLLAGTHEMTVYEAAAYAGGHSNTVDVTLDGISCPVDTGFLVHNDRTYPNLVRLLALLGVGTVNSDMSFSVSLPREQLEWAGSSLATVFAQKANLLRPGFWRMLRDILDFNRRAPRLLDTSRRLGLTLGELLDAEGYSAEFQHWYLLPMGAAIWSSPLMRMRSFPAETFLRFCLNHGLLQILGRPQWKTITGGSREYVQAMCRRIGDVRLNTPALELRREPEGVVLTTAHGEERYDRVILATHADQALALISDARSAEIAVLGSIACQTNVAWLHTDSRLMPRRRSAWSAWNYYAGNDTGTDQPVAVSYWLNRLQPLPFRQDVFVTLNPPEAPEASKVIRRLEYRHPLLDRLAYKAQQQLDDIQGQDGLYFCGAWSGYGFHEDGLKSGMLVARLLGAKMPWEAAP